MKTFNIHKMLLGREYPLSKVPKFVEADSCEFSKKNSNRLLLKRGRIEITWIISLYASRIRWYDTESGECLKDSGPILKKNLSLGDFL